MNWIARASFVLTLLASATAWAQSQSSTTSVGPGRIACRGPTACELDIGTPPSLRYKIDPSALAASDKDRLVQRCTAKSSPCIATVNGTDNKTTIKASSIKFYN